MKKLYFIAKVLLRSVLSTTSEGGEIIIELMLVNIILKQSGLSLESGLKNGTRLANLSI